MGIPFSIFVTTGYVNSDRVLWNDLLEFAVFSTRKTLLPRGIIERDLPLGGEAERCGAILALKAVLKRDDAIVINDSEVRDLTGEANVVKGAAVVRDMGPPIVVVKKGEHGCMLFCDENICTLPAYPASDVKDPTGAGDCFAGGMMGYLASADAVDFAALSKSLGFATIVASFAIEDFSLNRLKQISLDNINDRLHKFRTMSSF